MNKSQPITQATITQAHVSMSDDVLITILSLLSANENPTGIMGTVLSQIGTALHASYVSCFLLSQDKKKQELIHEWSADDRKLINTNFHQIEVEAIPWTMSQLWVTNPVSIQDNTSWKSHTSDQSFWNQFGLDKFCLFPMPIKRSLGGFVLIGGVCLDDLDDTALNKLQSVIQSIGANLSRRGVSLGSGIDAEGKYRTIFESVDDGLISVSRSGVIEDVNAKVVEFLGKDVGFFRGKYLKDIVSLFPDGSMNVILRNVGLSKTTGLKAPPSEVVLTGSDGQLKILEVSINSLSQDSVFIGDVIVFRDITYRKLMENSAQASESRLKLVLNSVKEGITLSDNTGSFVIYNPEMAEITGYTKDEANVAPDYITLLHSDGEKKDQILQALSKLDIGDRSESETTITTKSGEVKHLLVSTTVIFDGEKKLFLSAYRDISQIIQAELQLKQRNQELEETTNKLNLTTKALEQANNSLEDKVEEKTKQLKDQFLEIETLAKFLSESPFPFMRADKFGVLLYANHASTDLLHLWQSKVGDSLPPEKKQVVEESFATNNREIIEVELKGQYLSFFIVPIIEAGYVNLYGRDVTKEKELDQMKNHFVSMVSHQIRTPLTSMRWYSEMLLSGRVPKEKHQDIAKTIHGTSVHLAELVNDLLSISRLEAGVLNANPEKTSLISLIQDSLNELTAQAQSKHIETLFEFEKINDFFFDPKMIREVVSNLISNAIKYSREGSKVRITLSLKDKYVITSVSDQGLGIPKQAQPNIFSRFYRAQNAVDSGIEGTGLGLSVAKSMIEKCGGTIWFESQEHQGTTFCFSLQYKDQIDVQPESQV